MNKQEFRIFVSALRTYYPKENILPNMEAIELWYRQLNDIPYPIAEAGLNKWVATNKWSPAISDIREFATDLSSGKLPDSGEAWCDVTNAIRKYGYMRSTEAMNSFNEITQQAVNYIGGFEYLCASENPVADRANFYRCYDKLAERKHQDMALPEGLKETINKIQEGMQMPMLCGKG